MQKAWEAHGTKAISAIQSSQLNIAVVEMSSFLVLLPKIYRVEHLILLYWKFSDFQHLVASIQVYLPSLGSICFPNLDFFLIFSTTKNHCLCLLIPVNVKSRPWCINSTAKTSLSSSGNIQRLRFDRSCINDSLSKLIFKDI